MEQKTMDSQSYLSTGGITGSMKILDLKLYHSHIDRDKIEDLEKKFHIAMAPNVWHQKGRRKDSLSKSQLWEIGTYTRRE